ncbi:MAG: DNA translocase FtsK, partial [Dehalococcoidales bacterium]|nr:DNA translocase FtsK [Dehalococcoidales bacterium]
MPKKSKGSAGKGRWMLHWDWLFYGVLVILAAIAASIAPWGEVGDWLSDVWSNIWDVIGWGILLIALAILALVILIWRRKTTSLLRSWMKCLGVIALIFGAWGILAFLSLGGSFGLGIIGDQNFPGALRIFGILLASLLLVAPQLLIYFVKWVVKWLTRTIANARNRRLQRATMKPIVYKKLSMPFKETPDGTGPMVTETPTPKETKAPAKEKETAAAPAQKGLRQIAQDVWKKYGQSASAREVDGWRLPPIDILDDTSEVEIGQADNMQRAKRIEEALKSYGVEAKVIQINAGPTVTQFGVEPGWDIKTREVKEKDKDGAIQTRLEEVSRTRVKVDKITSLANDLALALAASSIRIEAPVPGKAIVGIEVPNTVSSAVSLRGVIETTVFQKIASKSKLSIALGKGAGGEAGAADLSKMPHLLIAG